jgi:hypothetical protein
MLEPYPNLVAQDIGSDPETFVNERLKKFLGRHSELTSRVEDINIEMMALIAEMRYLEDLINDCMDEKMRYRIDKMNEKLALASKIAQPAKK